MMKITTTKMDRMDKKEGAVGGSKKTSAMLIQAMLMPLQNRILRKFSEVSSRMLMIFGLDEGKKQAPHKTKIHRMEGSVMMPARLSAKTLCMLVMMRVVCLSCTSVVLPVALIFFQFQTLFSGLRTGRGEGTDLLKIWAPVTSSTATKHTSRKRLMNDPALNDSCFLSLG